MIPGLPGSPFPHSLGAWGVHLPHVSSLITPSAAKSPKRGGATADIRGVSVDCFCIPRPSSIHPYMNTYIPIYIHTVHSPIRNGQKHGWRATFQLGDACRPAGISHSSFSSFRKRCEAWNVVSHQPAFQVFHALYHRAAANIR